MDSVRKALSVKDKRLKAMQYISSVLAKADTVVLKDTVFKESQAKDSILADTVIGDAWYSVELKLKYPNCIAIKPVFKSQKYITVSTRKETVNPPKKWWLLRLFQRKHEVVIVDLTEESPYIEDSVSRYVEIVK